MKKILFTLILLTLCASCIHDDSDNNSCELSSGLHMKIYKSDESLQCETGSGIELHVMKKDLIDAGIDVICSQKGNDGNPVVLLCGTATGNINIFVINKSNYSDAEKLGFGSLEDLSNYSVDE